MMKLTTLWDTSSKLTWKQKVAYLSHQFIKCSNAPEMPVTHIFAPGVYIREIRIPKGTLFLGREHLHGHLCQLVSGAIVWITPDGKHRLEAPYQVYSKPGDHMVLYAITDVVGRTVHANITDSRDTQELEAAYFGSREEMLELGKDLYEYHQMFVDRGVDEELLRMIFENEADVVPLDKEYGVEVTDSPIQGKGVFATAQFPKGAAIAPARIDSHRTPVGRYTNHSFTPNTEFVGDEDLQMVALRDIFPHEELTVDYRVLYDRRHA